jgi:hypothetical protein
MRTLAQQYHHMNRYQTLYNTGWEDGFERGCSEYDESWGEVERNWYLAGYNEGVAEYCRTIDGGN